MTGMTNIVKTVTRIIGGVVFLFGLYIVTHGHLSPGGGFAGGTIIAGAFILLVLAYGDNVMHLRRIKEESSALENLAILCILIMAAVGFMLGTKVFFNNFLPTGINGQLISAGIIPLFNILIGIEVAAALFTIFLAFVIFKEEEK